MMEFNLISKVNNNLLVFRDDLYPFFGGGNKGRKMNAIAGDVYDKGAKAMVTTGGVQSNHCRAVAIFAAEHGLKCSLILHGSEKRFYKESGNAKIMRMSGAKIVFAPKPEIIGVLMDREMESYQLEGLNPYYIWGGGHTLEGGKAYIDAIAGLKNYCEEHEWFPEYIFLASGTGSTQSGIMVGLDRYGFRETKVIGISVARKSEQAEKIVREFYQTLSSYYGVPLSGREAVVLDQYLYGGYEQYNDDLKRIVNNSIKDYGFILDTCYSGKAFYGMLDYVRQNRIDQERILFWHTGGILNYLA